ncbi:hypothetical protein PFISCL1PPCAC_9105 [Pristionchus fissidentatus]|uniref:MSP domain-containing protein n=1 Tax=Pristionchus fissidentatus TaxID=1538716 RepID=A0AAV5VEW5_9BILA|nr:hypothetical protein PFISCL1PPCAC_9105 [Pristionchus fissidentatus]
MKDEEKIEAKYSDRPVGLISHNDSALMCEFVIKGDPILYSDGPETMMVMVTNLENSIPAKLEAQVFLILVKATCDPSNIVRESNKDDKELLIVNHASSATTFHSLLPNINQ